MEDYNYKLDSNLFSIVKKINNPIILELGVQKGTSTKKFLDICSNNNGKLFSADIDDCSKVSNDENWKFFHSRDDNFDFIKSNIPNKIDVLFIDTLHEARHVKKLIYGYYPLIKKNGYLFIDDISHLPYLKKMPRSNFYCEVNNKETFEILLSIYSKNYENFDLNFSFSSSGLAIIRKKTDNDLNESCDLDLRENSIKNILRKVWRKIKKD
jgi:hypothetical protein